MADKIKKSIKILLLVLIVLVGILGLAYGIQARYQIIKTDVRLEKSEEIFPAEPLAIDFSFPILASDYARNIKIEPAAEVDFHWENNRKLVITPQKSWFPETNYQIILPQGGVMMVLSQVEQSQLSFATVSYPRVTQVFPENGAKDVLLDIEDPIVVSFDKSVKGFYLNFTLDSQGAEIYQINPEVSEFKILPKDGIQDGKKYNLKIYAKYTKADDADYRLIYESNFETFLPASIVWEKNHALRLAQAGKYTRAKILAGKYVDINLKQQILSIFEDGKLLNSYMISSGKRGMDTPIGTFKIENKTPRAWSKTYGLYMPNWMAIVPSGKYGIHELPEWPGGYKEGAAHLGTPVSHGCVRLGVGAAKKVYDFAPIGTPVVIY